MTTRRHTSARTDQPRTHRSQSKPAKAQPILLDRLDGALCRQNVTLKRAALQSVAAAAFGFHNPNEFAAADLVPERAEVLGRVELGDEQALVVLRDPAIRALYGVDESFLREALAQSRSEQYGISPYGDLVDLTGVLADPAAGAPVGTRIAARAAGTPTLHPYAGETIHLARIENAGPEPVMILDLTEAAVAETVAAWCRQNWSQGGNPQIDPATLKNPTAVTRAFFAGRRANDMILGKVRMPSPPLASGTTIPVWVGYHVDENDVGSTYVDTTEVGLVEQIADEVGDAFRNAVETYGSATFAASFMGGTLRIGQFDLRLPDLGGVAPSRDDAWRTRVAEIRAQVEAADGGDHWAQHPVHDTDAWQQAVMEGDTRDGYWDWRAP